MKKIIIIMLMALMAMCLYSQTDSTFYKEYTFSGGDWDYFQYGLYLSNIIEDYDNNFVMLFNGLRDITETQQIPANVELVFNREGEYLYSHVNPYLEFNAIFKDLQGGYIATDFEQPWVIYKLDSNFVPIADTSLYLPNTPLIPDNAIRITDIELVADGFLVAGIAGSQRPMFAKYDFQLNLIWSWQYSQAEWGLASTTCKIFKRQDNFVFWSRIIIDGNPGYKLLEVNSNGDSIQTKIVYEMVIIDKFICYEQWYFAISTGSNYGYTTFPLLIWNCGVELDEMSVLCDIPFNLLYDNNLHGGFNFLKQDDGFLLLSPMVEGDVLKFSNGFHHQWTKSIIPQTIGNPVYVGEGKSPALQLPNGDILYGATIDMPIHSKAVLVRMDSEGNVVSNQDQSMVEDKKSFLELYPNPFNPELNIELKGKRSAQDKLEIFNIKGQLVHSINQLENKKYVWQPRALASGIYFARLSNTKGVISTKRITLLK